MMDFIIFALIVGIILAFYAQNKRQIDEAEDKIKDIFEG